MTRDEATAELARHADALRARGAEAAYLFGSTARGESERTAISTSSSTSHRAENSR